MTTGWIWATEAEPYRQKNAGHAGRASAAGLTDRVSESLVFTPETFRDRYLSPLGAGLFHRTAHPAKAPISARNNVSEELPGLYLAGAGTHPGAVRCPA